MKNTKRKAYKIVLLLLLAAVMAFSLSACSFLDWLLNSSTPEDYNTQVKEGSLQSNIFVPHLITPEQREANPIRYIDSVKDTAYANSLDELFRVVVTNHRRPILPDDTTKPVTIVWNKALEVLNNIILNDMTDFERVHAIYDWIIYNTDYDYELLDSALSDPESVDSLNPSFHLSGVFIAEKAVCSGKAKAFALLCAIENIEAEYVTGWAYSAGDNTYIGHAWNKVNIKVPGVASKEWYFVDTTYGDLSVYNANTGAVYVEYLSHCYFLITDNAVARTHFQDDKYRLVSNSLKAVAQPEAKYHDAVTEFDYYANETVTYNDNIYRYRVSSAAELESFVINYAIKNTVRGVEIKLGFADRGDNYASVINTLKRKMTGAKTAGYLSTPLTEFNVLVFIIGY
jgi:transglutaminase-like putative cysteine protease